MNNEELIMNNEKYKCFAFDVGAGPVSAQKSLYGITLISLIITIIIMLILAAITLTLTLGDHGIFKLAEDASKNYLEAQIKEENELAKLDANINNVINNEEILAEATKPEAPKPPDNTSNLYLYYKGYINEEITGGWITYTSSGSTNLDAGKAVIGKEYIQLKTWSHWVDYNIKTEKLINITNYNKIKFEIFDSTWTENSGYERCNFTCGSKTIEMARENIKDGIYEIDISDLSGEVTVSAISANGGDMKIRAIWLEK